VPHTGEVAFLGPLGGGDMNCLYRDVRMRRRRALGLALFQPVKHVVVTLRCGCAPSAAAGFKNYSAFTFYAKMFWHKVWACGYSRPHKFVDLLKITCDIYKSNRGGSTN
jgi:hypothetical protein